MKVAIVAESFAPTWNGVTGSVMRVLEHLERTGHAAMVIAPGPGPDFEGSARVVRVRSVRLPVYRSLPIGLPSGEIESALRDFAPDVVHLAAPVVLGDAGGRAALALGVPCVATYQTDIAGFARRYGLGGPVSRGLWSWLRRVHGHASLTLAPSSIAEWDLRRHGIGPVARWGRGVDIEKFHPRHRSAALRREILGGRSGVVVGYFGRLAPEKQVANLRHLSGMPGVSLVIVGDGPARRRLQRQLPDATFLGYLAGQELSEAVASMDVFVHPGPHETFCQAVQEAMAAGVPVVAPAAGGPLDLVQHGVTGWFCPAGEPEAMREAVASLACDAGLRSRMGAAARAAVRERTWAALGDQLLMYYARVIDGQVGSKRSGGSGRSQPDRVGRDRVGQRRRAAA